MPSSFTWLDHSEEDRRRVLEAVEAFKESGTRDELGLGVIRDRFSELLFPGTGTVQTRARYFLFVPWMYRALHDKARSGDRIQARARKDEIALRDALLASGETDGVIGRVAGASLKRLPSSVYWQGLGAWDIRRFPGSQDDYHRHFGLLRDGHSRDRDDDGEPTDDHALQTWHPDLPPPPEGFPSGATMDLTASEAEFLEERITFTKPDSLLAFLVRRGGTLEAPYIWEHPLFGEFPADLQGIVQHCQLLAEAMHGASLLYNLMLSEQLPTGAARDASVEHYRDGLRAWVLELEQRQELLETWDRTAFWTLTRSLGPVSGATHRLIEQWAALRPWRAASVVDSNAAARGLIRERERQLKGPRARIGNARALELWNGASGAERLNYRWPSARRILRDLFAARGGLDARA